MKIKIDGREISIVSTDKNIVDVATREGIGIPAPCYLANRSKGCCSACVVEIDGHQKFACVTKPEAEMDIVLNRQDLRDIRKERLADYASGVTNAEVCCCSGSSNGSCC